MSRVLQTRLKSGKEATHNATHRRPLICLILQEMNPYKIDSNHQEDKRHGYIRILSEQLFTSARFKWPARANDN